MITACDMMTVDPATLPTNATVRAALDKLQTLDIRHLPVVNDDGEVVGMVSDRDLRGFVSGETELDVAITTIMSGNVISVEEEADAGEVIDLMLDHKIGAVPVVDADGVIVGIVSYIDVLRTTAQGLAAE
jgi:CBS domain-containing protein